MRKWLVPLSGNRQVLYNFNDWVKSPDFCIFEDSEDHLGEAYFLESVHLNGETDLNVVLGKIKGLLELINGAAAIHWGFNNIFINDKLRFREALYSDLESPGLDDYSTYSQHFNLSEIPPLKPFTKNLSASELIEIKDTGISARVRMAESRDEISKLLRQISYGFDWRNLYSIWDTVTYYCGGEKKAVADLSINQQHKAAFTGTANSFALLGPDARHGEKGWAEPSSTMSHDDAKEFVHTTVRAYLKKYHCPNCFIRGFSDA
ncbi:hypothetical protein ACP7H9_07740 [Idiomarina sp. ST20R2A10]|uniref:hypothetical protein n=1 Tax=Idiomarina sp. ST20R2A10 TaxID=3418369 RepID=UPI003EC5519E